MKKEYAVIMIIFFAFGCKKSSKSDSASQTTQLTVNTFELTNITPTSVQAGGSVAGGALPITARGICYSNNTIDPTINDLTNVSGSGEGNFTTLITNLTPNSNYYFRAYATTSAGTSYGTRVGVTTPYQQTVPVLTLNSVISSFSMNANLDASFIDSGHAAITEKGFCWSTSPHPTTANSVVQLGSGFGFGYFSSFISSLTVNTTYYFRAYATNSVGTGYSNEESILTAYHIGEALGGGRIFYVDNTHIHGLITSTNDQSNGARWNNTSNPFTWINAYDFNYGLTNSNNIVSATGSYANAAGVCRSYFGGGYTDWYLPSVNELGLLSQQQSIIGGFLATNYWSSTASSTDNSTAYVINIITNSYDLRFKSEQYPVRAIRAF